MNSLSQVGQDEREWAEQIICERQVFVRRVLCRYLDRDLARDWVEENELLEVANEALVQAVSDLMYGETDAFDSLTFIRSQVHEAIQKYLAQVSAKGEIVDFVDVLFPLYTRLG